MKIRSISLAGLTALAIAGFQPAARAQYSKPASKKAAGPAAKDVETALAARIRTDIQEALKQLQDSGGFDAARKSLQASFDQVIAYADPADRALFRDAAFADRLVEFVAQADPATRSATLRFLLENQDLAGELVFLVKKEDKPAGVFATLARLREKREKSLNAYANLAAAICVVHDQPMVRRINENAATSADPVAIFDYYVANEQRLLFGVKEVPPELLVYVVDTTASIQEMSWALQKYAGDRNVGARFFDVDYDYDNYSEGKPKKVDAAGWNLPNILKYGGVCADQAYFAMTVGKAIGVPTTYTTGQSSEVGHAWVGFLQSDGKNAWWNFNTGRYEAYQGVRGNVEDPQTRKAIPDSYISLLADFVDAKEADRQAVIAMTDAAKRLIQRQRTSKAETGLKLPPPALPEGVSVVERCKSANDYALTLLEIGLSACPGCAEGWFTVRGLAKEGQLTLADKKKWAGVLDRLCGQRYPDFYLAVLTPMIETVDDVKEQNNLWNAAFKAFQQRMDLAAAVRMEQAGMWMKHDDAAKAGQCYEDVIGRYANAGPFVIGALAKAEDILRKAKEGPRLLALYQRAWSQMKPPKDMAGMFATQSNWYRVGKMYADRLAEAGQANEAAKVRGTLTAATKR